MKYFDVTWSDSETQMDEYARIFGPLLAWAINNDLISDFHNAELVERVRHRLSKTPQFFADICYDFCDGKICDQDFNALGNGFIRHYISDNSGSFMDDYFGLLGERMPENDSWATYDKLAPVFDRRFSEWRNSHG